MPQEAQFTIILEEDLEVAPDFFRYSNYISIALVLAWLSLITCAPIALCID